MSKNVDLDDEAVALLDSHKARGESYSKVVKKLIRPPIRTAGEFNDWLKDPECPQPDVDVIERYYAEARVRRRAKKQ